MNKELEKLLTDYIDDVMEIVLGSSYFNGTCDYFGMTQEERQIWVANYAANKFFDGIEQSFLKGDPTGIPIGILSDEELMS